MNTITFRAPAQEILDELGIPYKEVEEGFDEWRRSLIRA